MSCCDHTYSSIIDYLDKIFTSDIGLMLSVITIGLLGSVLHCSLMCGPLASMQFSLRLMNIPPQEMRQFSRFKAALLPQYYIGKGISYAIITSCIYLISKQLIEFSFFKYIAAILFLIIAIALFAIAIKELFNFSFFRLNIKWNIAKYANNKYQIINGIILGFIPCGYLYAVLGMIALRSQNLSYALLAASLFALTTVPVLFMISYFGNILVYRYKKIFSYFLSITLILSSYTLIKSAIKMF